MLSFSCISCSEVASTKPHFWLHWLHRNPWLSRIIPHWSSPSPRGAGTPRRPTSRRTSRRRQDEACKHHLRFHRWCVYIYIYSYTIHTKNGLYTLLTRALVFAVSFVAVSGVHGFDVYIYFFAELEGYHNITIYIYVRTICQIDAP